uniref:Lymphocyte antigen 75 n=1 Tax=Leptobrachium leishanense TaxID=445787 RepID=A0A8C5WHE4_9ANUR
CSIACLQNRPYIRHVFTIQHEKTQKCLKADSSQVTLASCADPSNATAWKWGSSHRLYNLASQMCLGLDLRSSSPVKLVPCDSKLMLFWRCDGGQIFGASMFRLTEENGKVTANLSSADVWRQGGSSRSICEVPYQVIYTTAGNSHGDRCEFPFFNDDRWHHDCVTDQTRTQSWCATTPDYKSDQKWGLCLKAGNNQTLQACYQFNTESTLKWKEAYESCLSQGADLLSITSEEELAFITSMDTIPDTIWTGLNRFDRSGGWQWSDHTPLSFINWNQAFFSRLDDMDCGTLDTDSGLWQNQHCVLSLPYVCKKKMNDTVSEVPDYWVYSVTECDPNWIPYNGFCYLLKEQNGWEDADVSCKKESGNLISLHSLADIEMVVTMFRNDLWSGFRSDSSPALFKWSDGEETHFTYWDLNEPNIRFNNTPLCVSFLGNVSLVFHLFTVLLFSRTNSRRHGDFCYFVDNNEVPFGTKCNLTITNNFEQEFINSLIKRENKVQGGHFWTGLMAKESSGDYFWQTLGGNKDLTFSNWMPFEPALAGGCVVVMTAGEHFGKWAVKDCKTFKAQSICKQSIGPSKTDELPEPSGSCAEGWINGSGSYCYKLFHFERLLRSRTWEEAEGFCEEFGANLVSFSHKDEINEFRSVLQSRVSDSRWIWTGLNKRNVALQGSWEWSDGRPVCISSVILPDEFQQEDYDLRDCVAIQVGFVICFLLTRKFIPPHSIKPFHCDATLDWVCQIPKGKINTHPLTTVFEGEEYWIVSDKRLSYQEAALYCDSIGSELATLDSYGAAEAIMKQLMEDTGKGSKVNLLYCTVHTFQNLKKRYTPIFCNQKMPFICESRNMSLLEINSTKTFRLNGSCPTDWSQFRDKCFRQISPKYVTFSEASEECKLYGGTLPTILSQTEQDFINQLLPKMTSQFWIGLQIILDRGRNEWVDGRDTTYVNYHPLLQGRFKRLTPFNPEVSKQCFYIMNDPSSTFAGTWDYTSCAEKQNVTLCQKYRDKDGTPQPPQPVPDTLEYNGHKYRVIHDNVTWYEALETCSQYNMSLVSITDQYQLSFLAVQVDLLNRPMWTGLSSNDDGVHFRWQNGKRVTLNRWFELDGRLGDCVYLDIDGFWKTGMCDASYFGAFCYQPPEEEIQQPAENHTQACPHRNNDVPWIPFKNSCYTFLVSHKRWLSRNPHDTRHACDALHSDAYILNIRDEAENLFVFNQLRPFRDLVKWVWLGIAYDDTEQKLRWHDQTFVKYSNWRTGRPSVTNNSFYSAMSIDGFWDIYLKPDVLDVLFLQQHSIVACKIELDTNEKYREPIRDTIPYEDKIYHIVQKKLTWYDAVRECKLFGGHLASVHSDTHQDFLEALLAQDGFPLWIGLSVTNVKTSVYEWSDGSPFDHVQIAFSKTALVGNCGFMDTKGFWRNKTCTDSAEGAVCYKQKNPQNLDTFYPMCPHTPGSGEWVLQKGFCYAFDSKIYNFSIFTRDQADAICQNLDPKSSLLTVNDAEENEFVTKYLSADPLITGRIWLGVTLNSTCKLYGILSHLRAQVNQCPRTRSDVWILSFLWGGVYIWGFFMLSPIYILVSLNFGQVSTVIPPECRCSFVPRTSGNQIESIKFETLFATKLLDENVWN